MVASALASSLFMCIGRDLVRIGVVRVGDASAEKTRARRVEKRAVIRTMDVSELCIAEWYGLTWIARGFYRALHITNRSELGTHQEMYLATFPKYCWGWWLYRSGRMDPHRPI